MTSTATSTVTTSATAQPLQAPAGYEIVFRGRVESNPAETELVFASADDPRATIFRGSMLLAPCVLVCDSVPACLGIHYFMDDVGLPWCIILRALGPGVPSTAHGYSLANLQRRTTTTASAPTTSEDDASGISGDGSGTGTPAPATTTITVDTTSTATTVTTATATTVRVTETGSGLTTSTAASTTTALTPTPTPTNGDGSGDGSGSGCALACPPDDNAPVCTAAGGQYAGVCEAACEAGPDAPLIGCGCLAVCAAVDEPVCGADGTTYQNDCVAMCSAVRIIANGPCPAVPTTTQGTASTMPPTTTSADDPCPFSDASMCGALQGACDLGVDHYVEGALLAGESFPGLETCLVGICCFCSQGFSADNVCNDAGTIHTTFGDVSVNMLCQLAPSLLAPGYNYTDCPEVDEGSGCGYGEESGCAPAGCESLAALEPRPVATVS